MLFEQKSEFWSNSEILGPYFCGNMKLPIQPAILVNYLKITKESLIREGDGGAPTLFRSNFSIFLSAQGPILKLFAVQGLKFFFF